MRLSAIKYTYKRKDLYFVKNNRQWIISLTSKQLQHFVKFAEFSVHVHSVIIDENLFNRHNKLCFKWYCFVVCLQKLLIYIALKKKIEPT